MASSIRENDPLVAPYQYAVRIPVSELPGFLSKDLVVEPGMRGVVFDDEQTFEEVPPGTYPLASLFGRFSPQSPRSVAVFLARNEELPVEVGCGQVPTRENLTVGVRIRFTVRMDDIVALFENLFGARRELSIEQLSVSIEPLVRQQIGEAIGGLSIEELTDSNARRTLDAALAEPIGAALAHYGLKFGEVRTLSIHHDGHDQPRRKEGDPRSLTGQVEPQQATESLHAIDEFASAATHARMRAGAGKRRRSAFRQPRKPRARRASRRREPWPR